MDNDPRRPPIATLACLTGFLLLTTLVALGALDHVDAVVRDAARDHGSDTLVAVARHLTDVLSPPRDAGLLAVVSVGVARRELHWWPVALATACGGSITVAVLAVKAAAGRPGPGPGLVPAHGGSFPSGHVAAALVCLGTIALLVAARRPRLRRWLLAAVGVLTVPVAAGVVYARFHWLSDAVGSVLVGVAVLGAAERWISRRMA